MPKYIVRYGAMRLLGVFADRGKETLARGSKVIARTSRGLEAGEILCEARREIAGIAVVLVRSRNAANRAEDPAWRHGASSTAP